MIEALVRHMQDEQGSVGVLTTYPDEDRQLADPATEVVSLTPRRLVFVDLPLAIVARAFPRRLRRRVLKFSPAMRAISSADVVADISGVSFADERGPKFNVYNAMLTLLPLLAGTPIVKCSQAVGPFGQRSNRWLARALLPRVERILARGAYTYDNVLALGVDPDKVRLVSDLAFTLDEEAPVSDDVEQLLAGLGNKELMVIMPSAVVEGWCDRHGVDHAGAFAEVIESACDELGVGVALVPHAYRASGKPRRMDDARVCRSIAARLGQRDDVVVIDRDLRPSELRAIVRRSEMLVASRFHGMVTGLSCSTPTVVIGWGHKYAEVLAQFEAEQYAFDRANLREPARVTSSLRDVWMNRDAVRENLATHLPKVRESAQQNFAVLREIGART